MGQAHDFYSREKKNQFVFFFYFEPQPLFDLAFGIAIDMQLIQSIHHKYYKVQSVATIDGINKRHSQNLHVVFSNIELRGKIHIHSLATTTTTLIQLNKIQQKGITLCIVLNTFVNILYSTLGGMQMHLIHPICIFVTTIS